MNVHAGEHALRFATMLLVVAGATACATQGGTLDTAAREIDVQVPSGGQHLPASLFVAEGRGPHPTLVWSHGFPGIQEQLDQVHGRILGGTAVNAALR